MPKLTAMVVGFAFASALNAWSADFEVNNTANAGPGSLRQAIHDANTNAGPDRIVFNISGDGVHTIQPIGLLPELLDPVVIDGYTQPGSSPNTLPNSNNAVLRIHLDGSSRDRNGLVLREGNSIIKGLVITRFDSGIAITSASNIISGNFIGTDPTGKTSLSNNHGILLVSACCNVIGGVTPADRNLISGNRFNAIRIEDAAIPAKNNTIQGNFIGVDITGFVPLPIAAEALSTISVRASVGLVVGGREAGAGNVIAGGDFGISIYRNATNTHVIGNFIGVGADGMTPTLGATGAGVAGRDTGFFEPELMTNFARIEANKIAFNRIGIVYGGDTLTGLPSGYVGFTVTKNSIFSNEMGGIVSSAHARTNDPGDWDTGPNGLQNFPELDSIIFGANTRISGMLSSMPFNTYTLEFFGNRIPHRSGYGEGETCLGSAEISMPSSGVAPFTIEFPDVLDTHPWITATATDPDGNTSIFSPAVKGGSITSPLFHVYPSDVVSLPGSNITFAADVTGAQPIYLQWRWDGTNIPNATSALLTLTNVQWEHRGLYSVAASNVFGVVESRAGELRIQAAPVVLTPSVDQSVAPGENVTFFAQGGGAIPLTYQWRRDGAAIPGATNQTLMLANVTWTNRGLYTVSISNSFGVTVSAPAELFVKVRPALVQQPLSQSIAPGEAIVLSVVVSNSATAPLSYRWRSNNVTVNTIASREYASFFPVSNLRSNVTYSVVVSNAFGPPGVLSANAIISVLPDGDRDGLPDAYETAHGLNPADSADAGLDTDGDGLTNRQEYSSGTDPLDRENALKVSRIGAAGGLVHLEFFAASNKTYSVQFHEALTSTRWRSLTNLPASRGNRTVAVTDGQTAAKRFYRLVSPAQP